MKSSCVVSSPLGALYLEADDKGLTALSFLSENRLPTPIAVIDSIHLQAAVWWLRRYFDGENPGALPALHFEGTPFQQQVWALLCQIPYGTTVSYGDLARTISAQNGGIPMAAQAVGRAVGKNPLAIIVPCHRVVGAKGQLTGYAAGLDYKVALLKHEGISLSADNHTIKR